jgi:hypothetical protein
LPLSSSAGAVQWLADGYCLLDGKNEECSDSERQEIVVEPGPRIGVVIASSLLGARRWVMDVHLEDEARQIENDETAIIVLILGPYLGF